VKQYTFHEEGSVMYYLNKHAHYNINTEVLFVPLWKLEQAQANTCSSNQPACNGCRQWCATSEL
jgi:hypothetical protein